MKVKKQMHLTMEWRLRYEALRMAFAWGESFTVQAFCTRNFAKVNRHTRAVLNAMVKEGLLAKHKTLFNDGHYRMVYCAQKTPRLI